MRILVSSKTTNIIFVRNIFDYSHVRDKKAVKQRQNINAGLELDEILTKSWLCHLAYF